MSTQTVLILAGAAVLAAVLSAFARKRRSRAQGRIRAAPLTEDERVRRGLSRTHAFFQQALDRLSGSEGGRFYDDVEEALLAADVGVEFSEQVVEELRGEWGLRVPARAELKSALARILQSRLPGEKPFEPSHKPEVVLILGVNGAGKTTTIAKLCSRFRARGLKVLVGAADTFRAAATEQLKTWVERVGAEGVFQAEGSDPSAVAFDAVKAAVSRGSNLCLLDTAGRLHTKSNLMEELKKMKRVLAKALPGAPHETWLVLDGTMGQNALNQAREFHQFLDLTGLIVTKLDGSAKGGAVFAIASSLKLPVIFIGVGEDPEDLVPFHAASFTDGILAGI
ncbi:MAG: signal recognition particle-docking protein FtsY [Deltaproteobacteria bacterium]|nr:signal recognition particle-docking protein FtsY [Deltaproteobacteria bacterium]